jgi:hypothetical protein
MRLTFAAPLAKWPLLMRFCDLRASSLRQQRRQRGACSVPTLGARPHPQPFVFRYRPWRISKIVPFYTTTYLPALLFFTSIWPVNAVASHKRQWCVCNGLPTELDSSPEQKEARDRLREAPHRVGRAKPSTAMEALFPARIFGAAAEEYGALLDGAGFDRQLAVEERCSRSRRTSAVIRHLSARPGNAPGLPYSCPAHCRRA